MKLALLILLSVIAGGGLFILLALQLQYVITQHHLKVVLFGLCIRRIRISDIDYVSKRQAKWAEKWYNTLHPTHRILVIHRRRGWLKDFVITPRNRYVCKAELERVLANLQAAEGDRT